jgi:hypothetical protein
MIRPHSTIWLSRGIAQRCESAASHGGPVDIAAWPADVDPRPKAFLLAIGHRRSLLLAVSLLFPTVVVEAYSGRKADYRRDR